MALGLYKPKEGYWVRVMTAGIVGVITLATAAWTWKQAALVAERVLPVAGWSLNVPAVPVGLVAGGEVELLSVATSTESASKIGTAKIKTADAANQNVMIESVTMNAGQDPTAIGAIKDPAKPASNPANVSQRVAIPIIEPTLLSGIVAAVIIMVGGMIGYWLAGQRAKTVEFLIATDFEMKRVNWSTPKEIIGSTYVVVGACFIITLLLFMFDRSFQWFFSSIGVLAG